MIGDPIPEVQWWFVEGDEPNETFTHLFDGARDDRVLINATYVAHATSTLHLTNLTPDDSGTYECRASNDPDRNAMMKTPKIKWIRSQANVIVIECEWQRTIRRCQPKQLGYASPNSKVPGSSTPTKSSPYAFPPHCSLCPSPSVALSLPSRKDLRMSSSTWSYSVA